MIGRVLKRLIDAGRLRREEVIVVSKVGYLGDTALDEARRERSARKPFRNMTEYGPDRYHCIHPKFVAYQLDRSLRHFFARAGSFIDR